MMACTNTKHHNLSSRFCPDCGEQLIPPVIRIEDLEDLQAVAKLLGVRPDWHEPDEQEVTAEIEGPNENFEGLTKMESTEFCVKLHKAGNLVAVINLATLFAMACGTLT